MATQADVEQVKVLCAFRGETRPDGQRSWGAQGAEVKGQRTVVLCVGEGAVAVATRVFLKEKKEKETHELPTCNLLDALWTVQTNDNDK